MNKELLHPEVRAFILKNENEDVAALILKSQAMHGVTPAEIAEQVKGRQKAKTRFPLLFAEKQTIFPPSKNLEQSSSEQTAKFKAELIRKYAVGSVIETGVDLTGGFGIDSLIISSLFKRFHYVEQNEQLFLIAKHNLNLFAKNIIFHSSSAEVFLRRHLESFDVVYIDPSRRSADDKKLIALKDCQPDVLKLKDDLLSRSKWLLVKTSPLLDLGKTMRDIGFVKLVAVVSVDNECREVLYLCERDFSGEAIITAVDLNNEKSSDFTFQFSEESGAKVILGEPDKFLYEPNASIMKAGAFKMVAKKFDLVKLHQNTHLYSSNKLITNFPGRIFNILAKVRSDKKELLEFFPEGKANVITRNYPLSPADLKKKTGLKDGGSRYLIGCTSTAEKMLLAAERV